MELPLIVPHSYLQAHTTGGPEDPFEGVAGGTRFYYQGTFLLLSSPGLTKVSWVLQLLQYDSERRLPLVEVRKNPRIVKYRSKGHSTAGAA